MGLGSNKSGWLHTWVREREREREEGGGWENLIRELEERGKGFKIERKKRGWREIEDIRKRGRRDKWKKQAETKEDKTREEMKEKGLQN